MTRQTSSTGEPTPFLDLRIGGLHVTIQRIPYRLLALLTAVGGTASGATWLGR
ncbi:hypothetical protein P8605_12865 [Streptomyces sp. T-3]|nr:hypothetical protein [Streptomyces sp. T-3]